MMDIVITIMNAIARDETARAFLPTFCERFIQANSPSPPILFLKKLWDLFRVQSKAAGDNMDKPSMIKKTDKNPKYGNWWIGGS